MRAYGNNTEILIDRDREARSHALCAERGLAPPLIARFNNGLLYRFISGRVCSAQDLTRPAVWQAVARRLGEWHARLPVEGLPTRSSLRNGLNGHSLNGTTDCQSEAITTRKPTPNIWTVMQKWVKALPSSTAKQQARRDLLQKELERSFHDLDNEQGLGKHGFVFGHCDLLSANVIILPQESSTSEKAPKTTVSFIDYEYAALCPAAFDIANHFAEWGGYDCDYNMLPTKSTRRQFLEQYLSSYNINSTHPVPSSMLETLFKEVDRYRGMPGLYWGIWALIQATISKIDFDYASYAEVRLGEYWAWRAESIRVKPRDGADVPLRECRWAEE